MLAALRSIAARLGPMAAAGLLAATGASAQGAAGSLTLQVAIDRAMAANATIAAARLRGPINLANLAVARERLNPEGSFELEKETPKEAYGVAVPFALGVAGVKGTRPSTYAREVSSQLATFCVSRAVRCSASVSSSAA